MGTHSKILVFFLLLILFQAAWGEPAVKSFISDDGAFSIRLDEDYRQVENPNAVMSLFLPELAFFIVCVEAPGVSDTPAQVKEAWPKSTEATILSSQTGKVGGRGAAFFVEENLFQPDGKAIEAMGLSSGSSFQSVVAIVPGSTKSYFMQAHYPKEQSKLWRKLALTIFVKAVVWH